MVGRHKRIEEKLDSIETTLAELRHDSELLRTVLVIREPDTVTAANAYEGLRKQIIAVAQEHWAHLAQLVEVDVSVNHTDDIDVVRGLVSDWLIRSGVVQLNQLPSQSVLSELFDELGGDGPQVVVDAPAYVDQATGRVIRKGRVTRQRESPPPSVARQPEGRSEALSEPIADAENGDAEDTDPKADQRSIVEHVDEPIEGDG